MKEVNIYIRTSLTGPCIKDGRWAAAMECQTSRGLSRLSEDGREVGIQHERAVDLIPEEFRAAS